MKGKTLKDVIGTEERSLYKLISLIADLSSLVREMIPIELGFAGGINPYGEKQLQIDVWSNDIFTKKLLRSGLVKRIGSEGTRFVSDGMIRQLPKPPTVYGIGGLREKWTPRVREFVESREKRKMSLRYGGSFVGDYNQ